MMNFHKNRRAYHSYEKIGQVERTQMLAFEIGAISNSDSATSGIMSIIIYSTSVSFTFLPNKRRLYYEY